MLGDGFDDDFEIAPRKPRPLHFSLAELEEAAMTHHDAVTKRALETLQRVPVTERDAWFEQSIALAELAHFVASADFASALRSPLATTLFRVVDDSDDVGQLPSPSSLRELTSLLRWRSLQLVDPSAGDSYADSPEAIDTPATYRAACLVFIGAAALSLFVQSNYTGPELDDAALTDLQPLPFVRSLLRIPDAAPGGRRDSSSWSERPVGSDERVPWEKGSADHAQPNAAGEVAEDADVASSAAAAALVARMEAPRPPVVVTSLAALGLGSGHELYEHATHVHFLVAARATLSALLPATAVPGAARGAAPEADPRYRRMHAAVGAMRTAPWWAARAVVAHERALVDRSPSAFLWAEARSRFVAAASRLCPQHAAAFVSDRDVFQRALVEAEFTATALDDENREAILAVADGNVHDDSPPDRHVEASIAPVGAFDEALPAAVSQEEIHASAPRTSRALTARLLLEWGHAQATFNRTSSAKTAFFLARRETGLRTRLPGPKLYLRPVS